MTADSTNSVLRTNVTSLLLAVIILPTIVYYAGVASSGALGTCIVALFLILRFMEPLVSREIARTKVGPYRFWTPGAWALVLIGVIAAHGSIAILFQPFNIMHTVASLAPLVLVLGAGCALGDALLAADDEQINRAAKHCLYFFGVVALIGIFGLSPPSPMVSPKALFPFTEPSHFALIFTPFFMFCCLRATGKLRYALLFGGFLLAGILENLTLVVDCFLVAAICMRGLLLVPVALLLGLIVAELELVDLSYYSGRLDFSEDTQNLSTIIYIQGWQLIGESLTNSNGWGLGFQQLGLRGTNVPAADIIFGLVQDYGNVLDGGFTFAKIVSEFGVLGFLAVGVFLLLAGRSFLQLRRVARGAPSGAARLFAQCVIVSFLVELFVRGTGYFNGTTVLLVTAFWILYAAPASRSPEKSVARLHPIEISR
jgi:hypothetical protein